MKAPVGARRPVAIGQEHDAATIGPRNNASRVLPRGVDALETPVRPLIHAHVQTTVRCGIEPSTAVANHGKPVNVIGDHTRGRLFPMIAAIRAAPCAIDLDAGPDDFGILGIGEYLGHPRPVLNQDIGVGVPARFEHIGPGESGIDMGLQGRVQLAPTPAGIRGSIQPGRLGSGKYHVRIRRRMGNGRHQHAVHGRGKQPAGARRAVQPVQSGIRADQQFARTRRMARQRPYLAATVQPGARGHACKRLAVVGAAPQGQAVAADVKLGHARVPPELPRINRGPMLSLIQPPSFRSIIPPCMSIHGSKPRNDPTPLK